MDYSHVCQGWIYTITNKINGKMYVGKTVNFTQRKWQHFHREQCPALKRAFDKYGVRNFEMKSILTFTAINRDILDKVLCELEKHYINKLGTYRDGYNVTKGGDGALGFEHTEDWKQSMSEKQKEYKAQDWVKEKDRQRMLGNTINEGFKRPILKYDLLGNFCKEYSWIGEAIDEIIQDGNYSKNWRSIHSNLIRALNGNNNIQFNNKAYDNMWRYKSTDDFLKHIEPFKRKKEKPIYHYSKDHVLLESYSTLHEAEQKTGISIKKLKYLSYNGGLRRKSNSVVTKDYWTREAI